MALPQLASRGAAPIGAAQAMVDHYRCPAFVTGFDVFPKLGDESGFFRFGDAVCFGRSAVPASDHAGANLFDAHEQVGFDHGCVSLPFDADEIVDNLRCERYCASAAKVNGLRAGSLARTLYYGIRPCLPVPVRRHIQRAYLAGWQDIPFPRWPVDRTVDQLLERLLALWMKAEGVETVPFIWFWPNRATSCVIVTHDVEHLAGRKFCSQLMDLDDTARIKSSFQIVPERRYPVPEDLLNEIRIRGFEINVHDLNHNGHLFESRDAFRRAAQQVNAYGRRYRAAGFRSGALYRNQAWFDALEFSYDMSVPSVAHLDPQRGGCCTTMPFFIGKILELPVTTIQDYTLFHILNDYSIDIWKRQLDVITRHHGLASIIVHPDYVIRQRPRATYQALLDHLSLLRTERQTWMALPRDVDRWWRQRSRMTVVRDLAGWRIEGPGKERARLAYATLDGDSLIYSFDDQSVARDATTVGSLIAH